MSGIVSAVVVVLLLLVVGEACLLGLGWLYLKLLEGIDEAMDWLGWWD